MNVKHKPGLLNQWRSGLSKLLQFGRFKSSKQLPEFCPGLPSQRGEINLGDLAKALSQLSGVSATEQDMIAQCLGFQLQLPLDTTGANRPFHPVQAAWNRPLLKQQQPTSTKPLDYAPKPAMPPAPEPPPRLDGEVLETEMSTTDAPNNNQTATTEILIRNALPLPLNQSAHPIPRHTLFAQQTARGIISATVMQPVPGQVLDIRRIIQASVRLQSLKKMPVLPRYSARNGCQLLLDFNEALMPWWEDLQSLIKPFQQLLSEDLCPVYEFDYSPKSAVRWTEQGEIPWQPIAYKPVIIASDLGVIQPLRSNPRAGKTVWLDFIQHCKRHNSPVIVLSPLLPQRCPAGLDRLLTLIHWHPATSAAMIKRLVASAGNRAR